MTDNPPRICLYMLVDVDENDTKVLWVRLGVTRAEAEALTEPHRDSPHPLYMHLGMF